MTIPEFLAMRKRAVDGFERQLREQLKTSDGHPAIDAALIIGVVEGYREGFDEAARLLESGPDNWPGRTEATPT